MIQEYKISEAQSIWATKRESTWLIRIRLAAFIEVSKLEQLSAFQRIQRARSEKSSTEYTHTAMHTEHKAQKEAVKQNFRAEQITNSVRRRAESCF